MWPSFSLCAWRILKIRSCLRRPLAPGRSRDRAILVSSVIFFSLSSAMVIDHLQGIYKGGCGWKSYAGQEGGAGVTQPAVAPRRNFPAPTERPAAPSQQSGPKPDSSFLESGARPVKLPGGLGGKLTQHIPISQSMQSLKNSIRTHDDISP